MPSLTFLKYSKMFFWKNKRLIEVNEWSESKVKRRPEPLTTCTSKHLTRLIGKSNHYV